MTVLRARLTLASFSLLSWCVAAQLAAAQDLPAAIRTSAACAPVGTMGPASVPRVRVIPSDEPIGIERSLFSAGQRVGVDQGTDAGVRVGERYIVRRPMRFYGAPRAEHTVGWLHVIEAAASSAIAQIDFACDAIADGDRVEPFTELTLSPAVGRSYTGGTLDTKQSLRVSYGLDGRSVQGDRDFVLAEGGQDRGVTPGMRYAAFSRRSAPAVDAAAAEAIVVAVYPDQALLRITSVHDGVFVGDQLVHRVGGTEVAATPAYERSSAAERLPDPPSRPRDVPMGANSPAADAPAPKSAVADRTAVSFEDVHFALDRASLRPEARTLLDTAVRALKNDPSLRLEIAGHTCNLGTAEYNLVLGQRRADTVKAYLVAQGIAASRLTTVSYGEEKPAHDNGTEEGRRLNRRAVLTVDFK